MFIEVDLKNSHIVDQIGVIAVEIAVNNCIN